MIDPVTLQDWSALGSLAAIFGIAVGVCSYHLGARHTYWQGYFAGAEHTRRQLIPRILRAKVDAQHVGRILGRREALQLNPLPIAPTSPLSPPATAATSIRPAKP